MRVFGLVMLGLPQYIWRLIPANPILLRVVETGGKRVRDMLLRSAYLAVLVLGVIVVVLSSGGTFGQAAGLSELTTTSKNVFHAMSYLQLFAVSLLAPIFTAGAITQEKDSQTYDILLSTPLTNAQIVLGSLLSRLFFVITLLVAGIPIFSITQVFGGVAIGDIARSFMIAAATAFVTGALAMAIATFKVGTRRTIFAFYLFIVIYLVGMFFLDRLDWLHPAIDVVKDSAGKPVLVDNKPVYVRSQVSWITPIHPFLAQRVVFNDKEYTPPAFGDLPPSLQTWPIGWALSSPHTFFTAFMFFLSFVLVAPSIVLLRRIAQSTVNLRTWILQKLHIVRGDRTRKPRGVWQNPIAWREAKTKASAARATVLRYGFMTAGLAGAAALLFFHTRMQTVEKFTKPGQYYSATGEIVLFEQTDTRSEANRYKVIPNRSVVTQPGAKADERAPVRPQDFGALLNRGWRADWVLAKDPRTGRASSTIERLDLYPLARVLEATDLRKFLLAAVVIEFAVILLIVTNAAASTVTREKEDGTLDLLLATPITSRYYIWGKLRGLVSFVLPLIAIPVISVGLFIIFDLLRWMSGSGAQDDQSLVLWESLIILPPMLIIVSAFAAIVGMHLSLRFRKTVSAVMSSVGIVVGLCGALGTCGYHALQNIPNELSVIVSAFSPFNIISLLIDPRYFAPKSFATPDDEVTARLILFIFSTIATGAYAGIVWSMYRSMVKNFDMTIRKQVR